MDNKPAVIAPNYKDPLIQYVEELGKRKGKSFAMLTRLICNYNIHKGEYLTDQTEHPGYAELNVLFLQLLGNYAEHIGCDGEDVRKEATKMFNFVRETALAIQEREKVDESHIN